MSLSESKMPIISIIVPVYNGEKYIRACVESLINQDYSNIEIILVNDGSLDSSKKIIDEIANSDNRIIAIHQENSGVSTARNHGIKKSKGDYLCFVDVDDYVTKDYVSYMYKMIKETVAIKIILLTFGRFLKSRTRRERSLLLLEKRYSGKSSVLLRLSKGLFIMIYDFCLKNRQ